MVVSLALQDSLLNELELFISRYGGVVPLRRVPSNFDERFFELLRLALAVFPATGFDGSYSSLIGLPTIPTTTTQIAEGTNLYYTDARVSANSAVAANTAKLITIATGAEVNVNADWNAVSGDAQILNKPTIPTSTTQITEGTRLYYTEDRVSANSTVAANTAKLATIATGAEVNVNADWSAGSGDAQILNKPTIPTTTSQIAEGTNLYYTEARVTANSTVAANTSKLATIASGAEVNVNADWNATSGDAQILNKPTIPTTTTQIAEGTNLYYTEARVTANNTVAANTTKLATIATGAEVNVNADWNATSGDAQILNKPTIPTTTTQIAEGTRLYYLDGRVNISPVGQYTIAQTCQLYVGASATAGGVNPDTVDPNLASVGFVGIAPFKGSKVGLYDTSSAAWELRDVVSTGLSLSGLTANSLYDLYLGFVSSALALQAVAWGSSDAGTSTRAVTPIYVNGVPLLPSDQRYRLVATFRTSGTGTTSDNLQNRLVSNVVHKRWKRVSISNYPIEYTYASNIVREFGNGVSVRASIATADPAPITVSSVLECVASSASLPIDSGTGRIGINSTTAHSGQCTKAISQTKSQRVMATFSGLIPAGYSYVAMLESGFAGDNVSTSDIQMRSSTLDGMVYL